MCSSRRDWHQRRSVRQLLHRHRSRLSALQWLHPHPHPHPHRQCASPTPLPALTATTKASIRWRRRWGSRPQVWPRVHAQTTTWSHRRPTALDGRSLPLLRLPAAARRARSLVRDPSPNRAWRLHSAAAAAVAAPSATTPRAASPPSRSPAPLVPARPPRLLLLRLLLPRIRMSSISTTISTCWAAFPHRHLRPPLLRLAGRARVAAAWSPPAAATSTTKTWQPSRLRGPLHCEERIRSSSNSRRPTMTNSTMSVRAHLLPCRA